MIRCEHRWGLWTAAFLYFGFLGSRRRCHACGAVERRILGGYDDERCNRLARYLSRRIIRPGWVEP